MRDSHVRVRHLQVLGATSEDTSEYYEKGLLAPGVDYDAPHPYLRSACDIIDDDGYVSMPAGPNAMDLSALA